MAGLLAEAFDGVTVIDLCDRQGDFGAFSFTEKDVCLVAVPSYGGRVPDAAAQRLGRMNGGGARAVLVAVYGNRAIDDTLLELKDILTAQGFRPVAAVAAVAEHSTMHQFGAGRPDPQDRQQLAGFAEQIRRTLASGAVPEDLAVPGNRPYREYRRNPMQLNVTDRCIRCGSCARACPVGAIPQQDPSVTDRSLCISCMRCVSLCPQGARQPDKQELAAHIEKLRQACSGRKPNSLYR